MEMSEAEKALLNYLNNSLGPFENFVAKIDIEEPLPLVPSRMFIIDKIVKLLNSADNNVITPIIGDVGQGKTHICWQIKQALKVKAIPVFVEIPADAKLFYYNLYTGLVEYLGAERLRDISVRISDLWGAKEKKYGLFRTSNVESVLQRAKTIINYDKNPHKSELEDCMRIIITHAIDPDKSSYAERWLLGQIMDPDELYYLGVSTNLNGRHVAMELLKLLLEYLPEGILLIIDDIDEDYERYNSPDVFEDDWTRASTPVEIQKYDGQAPEFFHDLSQLFLDFPNIHLIFTLKPQNQDQILSYFSPVLKEKNFTEVIALPDFTKQDLEAYYQMAIHHYCKANHLQNSGLKPLFPWNSAIIQKIFEKSGGNPRKVIRKFQDSFDFLLYDRESIENIEGLL